MVDMADDTLLGIVGREGAFLCRLKFFLCQQAFYFLVFAFPARFPRRQGVCKAAPAHKPGKGNLFLCGRYTPLRLQFFQQTDSSNIVPALGFCAAIVKMVFLGKAVIQSAVPCTGIKIPHDRIGVTIIRLIYLQGGFQCVLGFL